MLYSSELIGRQRNSLEDNVTPKSNALELVSPLKNSVATGTLPAPVLFGHRIAMFRFIGLVLPVLRKNMHMRVPLQLIIVLSR